MIEVPLPSKREMCQFTLKPISDTVSWFCKNIKCEDKGIEIVYVYSTGKFERLQNRNLEFRNSQFLTQCLLPTISDYHTLLFLFTFMQNFNASYSIALFLLYYLIFFLFLFKLRISAGSRIAGSTSVQHLLLQGNFRLRINDFIYTVEVPSLRDATAVRFLFYYSYL